MKPPHPHDPYTFSFGTDQAAGLTRDGAGGYDHIGAASLATRLGADPTRHPDSVDLAGNHESSEQVRSNLEESAHREHLERPATHEARQHAPHPGDPEFPKLTSNQRQERELQRQWEQRYTQLYQSEPEPQWWAVGRIDTTVDKAAIMRVERWYRHQADAQLAADRSSSLFFLPQPFRQEPTKDQPFLLTRRESVKLDNAIKAREWDQTTNSEHYAVATWFDRAREPRLGDPIRIETFTTYQNPAVVAKPAPQRRAVPWYGALEPGEREQPIYAVYQKPQFASSRPFVCHLTADPREATRTMVALNQREQGRQIANDERRWRALEFAPSLRQYSVGEPKRTIERGNHRAELFERVDPDGTRQETVLLSQGFKRPDGSVRQITTEFTKDRFKKVSREILLGKRSSLSPPRQPTALEQLRELATRALKGDHDVSRLSFQDLRSLAQTVLNQKPPVPTHDTPQIVLSSRVGNVEIEIKAESNPAGQPHETVSLTQQDQHQDGTPRRVTTSFSVADFRELSKGMLAKPQQSQQPARTKPMRAATAPVSQPAHEPASPPFRDHPYYVLVVWGAAEKPHKDQWVKYAVDHPDLEKRFAYPASSQAQWTPRPAGSQTLYVCIERLSQGEALKGMAKVVGYTTNLALAQQQVEQRQTESLIRPPHLVRAQQQHVAQQQQAARYLLRPI